MRKMIVAGALIAAVAGSSLVYAQQRHDSPDYAQRWKDDSRDQARRWQPSMEDRRAFGEARLAALRAGLVLRPDQEKNWPAFEQAVREFNKLRLDRMAARSDARNAGQQQQAADPAERLRRRGTAMTQTGAALTRLADSMAPLYGSLDDAQKKRFALLARSLGPRAGMSQRHMDRGERGDRGDRHGRGERYRGQHGHHGHDGAERGDRAR